MSSQFEPRGNVHIAVATYIVKEGNETTVEEALRAMIPPTRREPGCLAYTVQRSQESPRKVLLYEVYVDEAAVEAHRASPHFQQYVLGIVRPLVENRVVEVYRSIEE
jgi:autoinducer 2-degrading protein